MGRNVLIFGNWICVLMKEMIVKVIMVVDMIVVVWSLWWEGEVFFI